ncbi:hypothetical protein ACWDQO_33680 [Streptomyces sp. NPDC003703]|uniref:hypothetical protein n=1 Tax=Streptomyces sp. NPDC003283 TaxID=3364681 RepID=UPI0036BA8BA6
MGLGRGLRSGAALLGCALVLTACTHTGARGGPSSAAASGDAPGTAAARLSGTPSSGTPSSETPSPDTPASGPSAPGPSVSGPPASGPPPSGAPASGGPAAPLPADAPAQEADPAKSPADARAARALIRAVIADEALVGGGARRAAPYESDPDTWAVLGEDCVWRRAALPAGVLGNLRRDFEVPGAGGAPALRLSAEVTVHRTALLAAWDEARMAEEALRCPGQTPRAGARLTGLTSGAYAWGEGNNAFSDDTLIERGQCVSDTRGGPYPYWWTQATFGPVVVSASLCGGTARDEDASVDLVQTYFTQMLGRVKTEIARPAGTASGTPSGTAGPSVAASGRKGT